MVKKLNLNNLLTIIMVTLLNFAFFSCSSDNDEKLDDGSNNTTDVAVTSNVSKVGVTYAHIDGYVNLNLITSTYTNPQIGVELAMSEDFVNAAQAKSKELEGNKLSVKIDTLSSQTKYYYRTFVKVNDLIFYGEKRSFTTKDFSNIISTVEVSDTTYSSAKIICQGDTSSIDKENKFSIGIAYSTSQTILHPDSASNVYYGYYYNDNNPKGFNVAQCSMDSLMKNNSFDVSLTQLQTETRYYYCSFTRAGKKYKLGEVNSFTTNALSDDQISTDDTTENSSTSENLKIPLITFDPTDTTWMIRLTNPDDAMVRWRVDNEISWLTCEPSSGRIKAKGVDSLMLIVDRTGYLSGEYDGSFFITVGAKRRQVDVIMKVK